MALNAQALDDGGSIVTPKDNPTSPGPDPSASPTTPYSGSAGQDAPVAPTAPPSSVVTDPGYTPDWNNLLQNDSGYQAAKSGATAAQQNADAQRRAAIRAAFIQYGGDMPAGFSDAYGDIDQATQDAAKANQFSSIANLKTNYDQSVEQFRRALAARGMVGSGDMNYGQVQLDRGYGQGQYDAANQFGNGLTNDLNAYTGVLTANQGNLVNALGTAESNQYANQANRPVAASSANLDSALTSQYNVAIYTDADGNMYTQDGQPWTPPAPSASASAGPYAPSYDTSAAPGNYHYSGVQM